MIMALVGMQVKVNLHDGFMTLVVRLENSDSPLFSGVVTGDCSWFFRWFSLLVGLPGFIVLFNLVCLGRRHGHGHLDLDPI